MLKLLANLQNGPLLEVKGTQQDVLVSIFRRATGRFPSSEEMGLLDSFYQAEINTFSGTRELAQEYLSNGEASYNREIDSVSLAALAVVANALMNTDEGYTRR